jgi:hypothetical protein
MKSDLSGTNLRDPISPFDAGLAGAIVAYLLNVVALRDFGLPEAASTLLSLPAIAISIVLVLVAHQWLWSRVAGRTPIDNAKARKNEDFAKLLVEDIATFNAERELVLATSRWWHYCLATLCGALFGLMLSVGLLWLLW